MNLNEKAILRMDPSKINKRGLIFRLFGPINKLQLIITLLLLLMLVPFEILFFYRQFSSLQIFDIFLCVLILVLGMIFGWIFLFVSIGIRKGKVRSTLGIKSKNENTLIRISGIMIIIFSMIYGFLVEEWIGLMAIGNLPTVGLLMSVLLETLTTRIYICESCVHGPTLFKKINHDWTCLVCGAHKD